MEVVTIKFDGTENEMIRIVNEQSDSGYRLTSINQTDGTDFISFVRKDFLTTDEKMTQVSDQLNVIQKAIDNLALGGLE